MPFGRPQGWDCKVAGFSRSPVLDEVGMLMFARYVYQRKILPRGIVKRVLAFL